MESHQLDQLIEAIQASPKYKGVSSDLVRYIGTQELAKGHNLKEAIKATKNKLHQVGGAYQDSAPRYRAWLDKLKQASQTETGRNCLLFANGLCSITPPLENACLSLSSSTAQSWRFYLQSTR